MEDVKINKMIKSINNADYASARDALNDLVEEKIQERIREAMNED